MYDNIKTVKDLLFEVSIHGLSLKPEDIATAQDIVGHATVHELITLAQDNGRQNDNSDSDPQGNWSSGSDGTQQQFLNLIFQIWHWEDAVRFYNEHVNPIFRDLKAERNALVERNDKLSVDCSELLSAKEAVDKENIAIDGRAKMLEVKNKSLLQEIGTKEQTILELKAKLYDLQAEKDMAVSDLHVHTKCAICQNLPDDGNLTHCKHYNSCGLAYVYFKWRGQKNV